MLDILELTWTAWGTMSHHVDQFEAMLNLVGPTERDATLLGADSNAIKILGSASSQNYIICINLAPTLGFLGQFGDDIGCLGAGLGAMPSILGSIWAALGNMLHLLGPTWGHAGHARLLGADSKAMKIHGSACSRNYIICTHLAPNVGLLGLTWG